MNQKGNILLSATIVYILFNCTVSLAQTETFKWAKSFGGKNGAAVCKDMIVDETGNIYLTGSFQSQSIQIDQTTLINNGKLDIYVVKFASNGNVLWAQSFGGLNDEEPSGIALEGENLYITGYFRSYNLVLGSETLINKGERDIFLIKLNTAGNLIWAESFGASQDETSNCITTDGTGKISIMGNFNSSDITFGSFTLTCNQYRNIYLTKLNPEGGVIWANNLGGNTYGDEAQDLVSDSMGNIYITGSYVTSIIFGNDTLTVNNYAQRSYIAKINSNGTSLWGKSNEHFNIGKSIIIDPLGDILVGGDSTLYSFGWGWPLATSTFSVTKYDSDGNNLWTTKNGGSSYDISNGLTTDKSGNIYQIGTFFNADLVLGTDTLKTIQYRDYHYPNIFIAKYNSSGEVVWAKNLGGIIIDEGISIATNKDDEIFISGYYESDTLQIGSTILTNDNDTGSAYVHLSPPRFWRYSNVFITKLSDTLISNIAETDSKIRLSIYPNPSPGSINIEMLASGNIKSNLCLKILDVNGRLVFQKELSYPENEAYLEIDLSHIPKGLYFAQIINSNDSEVRKLVLY